MMSYTKRQMFEAMSARLDIGELRKLCFYLSDNPRLVDLNYDNLASGLEQGCIDLLEFCQKRGVLDVVVETLQGHFPYVLDGVVPIASAALANPSSSKVEPALTVATVLPQPKDEFITPWNPYHWFLVLEWYLFKPQRLKAYQTNLSAAGTFRLRQCGGWIVSILTYLHLLILAPYAFFQPNFALKLESIGGPLRWIGDHWVLVLPVLLLWVIIIALLSPFVPDTIVGTSSAVVIFWVLGVFIGIFAGGLTVIIAIGLELEPAALFIFIILIGITLGIQKGMNELFIFKVVSGSKFGQAMKQGIGLASMLIAVLIGGLAYGLTGVLEFGLAVGVFGLVQQGTVAFLRNRYDKAFGLS